MRIRAAGLSSRGSRLENEDHYCIGQYVGQGQLYSVEYDCDSRSFRDYGLLFAVADGIGAYVGGAYASKSALLALQHQFYGEKRTGCSWASLAGCLQRYLRAVQSGLLEALSEKPGLTDAGTTLAGVALMPPDLLVVFHTGDSRVLRASAGFVRALTVDHTVLGQDIASGRITELEASQNPELLRLTRALGAGDLFGLEVGEERSWAPSDRFMLCTDGFHGVGSGLTRNGIRRSLVSELDTTALVKDLLAEALAADGRDNATLVLVDIEDGGKGDG